VSAALPGTMTAVEIAGYGGPGVLRPVSRPVPRPAPGEVLIRVAAAGVNRPDMAQRAGKYPPPPGASDIPGLEVAGHIAALGEGVSQWRNGDAVCALLAGGGYAEYALAPAGQCMPVPRGLSMVEGASLPETFLTVYSNLWQRAHLQAGESLLVHGGSSGIGVTAIQLAKALGNTVYVTAGSDEKCRACEALGADGAINYRSRDFVAEVKRLTGGRGVDVVLDMVAGDYVRRDIEVLADDGRLVILALLGGSKGEVPFDQVMRRRLTVTGSTLRARPVEFKARLAREVATRVWPLIEDGRVKPVIHGTFPLAEAARAHELMESSTHVGKIVLVV
jgi:NADPH2:quinone reductase